ncbi:MAG: hypothetical protein ACHBN1_30675 [Heteroscytonema crispum UTEX LB 1556]
MTAKEPVLTDSKTWNEVVNCLTENIPRKSQGKCEQKNIFEILIRAATQRDSLENTSKVLKNVPTSNDIRYPEREIFRPIFFGIKFQCST